jgi:magnesium transporter
VRTLGPDYLAYALLDAVVDSYFPLLEQIGDRLEQLEEDVVSGKGRDAPKRLLDIRHDLLTLRRAIWPLREVLSTLYRDETPFIDRETQLYLRDCYDHAVQLLDVLEAYREMASGLMDVHLSTISNRMNEIMKVLTVIATIFIPLTFVSSIYGMNFDPDVSRWNMPELRWRYGYPFALAVMLAMTIGLLVYFRSRGWLRSEDLKPRRDPESSD